MRRLDPRSREHPGALRQEWSRSDPRKLSPVALLGHPPIGRLRGSIQRRRALAAALDIDTPLPSWSASARSTSSTCKASSALARCGRSAWIASAMSAMPTPRHAAGSPISGTASRAAPRRGIAARVERNRTGRGCRRTVSRPSPYISRYGSACWRTRCPKSADRDQGAGLQLESPGHVHRHLNRDRLAARVGRLERALGKRRARRSRSRGRPVRASRLVRSRGTGRGRAPGRRRGRRTRPRPGGSARSRARETQATPPRARRSSRRRRA